MPSFLFEYFSLGYASVSTVGWLWASCCHLESISYHCIWTPAALSVYISLSKCSPLHHKKTWFIIATSFHYLWCLFKASVLSSAKPLCRQDTRQLILVTFLHKTQMWQSDFRPLIINCSFLITCPHHDFFMIPHFI